MVRKFSQALAERRLGGEAGGGHGEGGEGRAGMRKRRRGGEGKKVTIKGTEEGMARRAATGSGGTDTKKLKRPERAKGNGETGTTKIKSCKKKKKKAR